MDRREAAKKVGRNVKDAAHLAGILPNSIAQATDMRASELNDRLDGVEEFSLTEFVRVGGLLGVSPSSLLEGAGA